MENKTYSETIQKEKDTIYPILYSLLVDKDQEVYGAKRKEFAIEYGVDVLKKFREEAEESFNRIYEITNEKS